MAQNELRLRFSGPFRSPASLRSAVVFLRGPFICVERLYDVFGRVAASRYGAVVARFPVRLPDRFADRIEYAFPRPVAVSDCILARIAYRDNLDLGELQQ